MTSIKLSSQYHLFLQNTMEWIRLKFIYIPVYSIILLHRDNRECSLIIIHVICMYILVDYGVMIMMIIILCEGGVV
jgi:hypothetical protein